MLIPIKIKYLNSLIYKKNLSFKNITSNDPYEFNKSIQNIRFGNTFKTSAFNRLKLTYDFVINLRNNYSNVADIGSSDGSSSLKLIDNLKFKKFFFLDKYDECRLSRDSNKYYLLDIKNNLHMLETSKLIIYFDPLKKNKNLLNLCFDKFFKKDSFTNVENISFLNPIYKIHKKRDKIFYKKFDLFDNIKNDLTYDLIFMSNILNKFHSEASNIEKIKKKINSITHNGSIVIIAENTNCERSTIYKKNQKKFKIIKQFNSGSLSEKFINL